MIRTLFSPILHTFSAAILLLGMTTSMTSVANGSHTTQEFLDSSQYTENGIRRYEEIFGRGFTSIGGAEVTQELTASLKLQPGQKVLDVGCGLGGSAIHMAKLYGASVTGMDLSKNMIAIAKGYAAEAAVEINFESADIMTQDYPAESFDVIFSRDAMMHFDNLPLLFTKFYRWLKPGGKLLISTYNAGKGAQTQAYKDYLADRNYFLVSVEACGKLMEKTGFKDVQADDRSGQFINILQHELSKFEASKDTFLQTFSAKDYSDLTEGWKNKISRCNLNQQTWGVFQARKPH